MVVVTDTVHTFVPIADINKVGYVLIVLLALALASTWAWLRYVQSSHTDNKMKRAYYGTAAVLASLLAFTTYTGHQRPLVDYILCAVMIACAVATLYWENRFRDMGKYEHRGLTIALRRLTFYTSLLLAACYWMYSDPFMERPRTTGFAVMAVEVLSVFVVIMAVTVAIFVLGVIAQQFKHNAHHSAQVLPDQQVASTGAKVG